MKDEQEDFEMWKYLFSVSECLTKETKEGRITKQNLLDYLETIEVVFGGTRDPYVDFQGCVVLELCRSIRRSLNSL